jgi:hypothetical protein
LLLAASISLLGRLLVVLPVALILGRVATLVVSVS